MTTKSPFVGLMPVVQQAAAVIGAFTGTAQEARSNNIVSDALEILGAIGPLVDSFSRGIDVTPEDVRAVLSTMDDAIAAFEAEIAKHGG